MQTRIDLAQAIADIAPDALRIQLVPAGIRADQRILASGLCQHCARLIEGNHLAAGRADINAHQAHIRSTLALPRLSNH